MHYKAKITVEIECNKLTCGKCTKRFGWCFLFNRPLKMVWVYLSNGKIARNTNQTWKSKYYRCQECLDKFK